jgi:hypothetical protein
MPLVESSTASPWEVSGPVEPVSPQAWMVVFQSRRFPLFFSRCVGRG